LSGGNKRKLSVAIAMMGNPPVLLLDEPSTGMDPEAKRFMWTVIQNISTKKKKTSVVITTHSMDEAEALAERIGIMVAGKFICLGTAQHLKSKYGEGYEIYVRAVNPTQEEIEDYLKMKKLDKEAKIDMDEVRRQLKDSDVPGLE